MAGCSATLQLPLQVVKVYSKYIYLFAAKCHEKVPTVQTSDSSSFLLGDFAMPDTNRSQQPAAIPAQTRLENGAGRRRLLRVGLK